MESIGVSKLRENMVLFLNKVQQGECITITSRGTEIAMLIPIKKKKEVSRNALKQLRKTAVVGDVVSPIEEEWKAKRKYSVKLDEVFCNGCSLCEMACIYDAITMKEHKPVIDYQTCSNCCLCHVVCPQHAIKVVIE